MEPYILQIIFVGISGIFSMFEVVVSSIHKNSIQKFENHPTFTAIKKIKENPGKYRSTVQTGITWTGFIATYFALKNFVPLCTNALKTCSFLPASTHTAFALCLVIFFISYFYLVFGEIVPKRMARNKIDVYIPKFSKWIVNIGCIFTFFTSLLNALANVILKILHIDSNKNEKVSEEEIRMMIHESSQNGNIDVPQKEFIENVFELDDTTVEEICTHRNEAIALYLEDAMDEWRQVIHDNRHTFYPVCGEDEDDIVGVLDTRDYFRLDENATQNEVLQKALDEPFFVTENTKANSLLHEMKNRRNYFAVVLDEYGGVTGIVTLHDIIETLLGEINEEDDEIEPAEIQKIDDNQWWIYGSAFIEDVEEQLNIDIPNDDYETFSGYVLDCYGKIPDDGTQFEVQTKNLIVSVKEMKNHRVGLTLVQRKESL